MDKWSTNTNFTGCESCPVCRAPIDFDRDAGRRLLKLPPLRQQHAGHGPSGIGSYRQYRDRFLITMDGHYVSIPGTQERYGYASIDGDATDVDASRSRGDYGQGLSGYLDEEGHAAWANHADR